MGLVGWWHCTFQNWVEVATRNVMYRGKATLWFVWRICKVEQAAGSDVPLIYSIVRVIINRYALSRLYLFYRGGYLVVVIFGSCSCSWCKAQHHKQFINASRTYHNESILQHPATLRDVRHLVSCTHKKWGMVLKGSLEHMMNPSSISLLWVGWLAIIHSSVKDFNFSLK